MMYRQAIIWVGATVSPTMAIVGTAANYALFHFSRWKLLHLHRPPKSEFKRWHSFPLFSICGGGCRNRLRERASRGEASEGPYLPGPWGANKAKATYSKFLFVTLIFCGGPLVAWLTRAPICGAHAGVVVVSTYEHWLNTEASPFIRNTVGWLMVSMLQGAPLFCLLSVAIITIYFLNAQTKSLLHVIET
eukprot:SAG11_NODE_8598_length_997_cov_0.918708_2_plen_189_part_01